MEHRERFENIRELDSSAHYLVRFIGGQEISNAIGQVICNSAPEYSFEDKEGTSTFQVCLVKLKAPVKCTMLTDF